MWQCKKKKLFYKWMCQIKYTTDEFILCGNSVLGTLCLYFVSFSAFSKQCDVDCVLISIPRNSNGFVKTSCIFYLLHLETKIFLQTKIFQGGCYESQITKSQT